MSKGRPKNKFTNEFKLNTVLEGYASGNFSSTAARHVVHMSQIGRWKQQLLESFSSTLKALIPEFILENIIIRESIKSLREIDKFNDPKGLYIRCENCLI